MKKLLLILFLIPNLVMADGYQSCKRLEKSEKRYLPDVVNRILTIESFKCSKKNNRVIGTYTHLVDPSIYDSQKIKNGFDRTLNTVCKYAKKYLRKFDLEYSYYSKQGDYIGSNLYKYSDCN